MPTELRYVGPFDQVRLPLPTGGELNVEHGGIVTVPDDLVESLLDQPANWMAVLDPEDAKVDDLKAELDRRGVAYDAKARKAELLKLLEEAETPPPGPDRNDIPAGDGDAN